ncbi:MAG: flagellar basal body rod protein FlgG [Anaerolinea sp.]|nr:flagellar basal body rod protein FlgG [Anaerolinea sp.]
MVSMLGAAASGLLHNQNVMDVVGNNLANVNTYAYKKIRAQAAGRPTANTSTDPTQQTAGSRMGVAETTTEISFAQAAAQSTGNPLHFSIQDDTFFRVTDLDGTPALTRLGALTADAAGNITVPGGRLLEPPVVLPEGMTLPEISEAGVISALDETGARQPIGQVTLVRFMNPAGLEIMGNGLYREGLNSGPFTEGTPTSEGFAGVLPGTLEGSNVEIAEEFTNMIIAQRAYQAAAKTFSVGDEMLRIATDLTQ